MRALAFDHFFDQDLSALAAALRPEDELEVVGYQRLHRLARRHFDADAFTGVAAAYDNARRPQWETYLPAAEALADWWAAAYRPDVFITPTDAIFYLRPVIQRLAALGCRTVVVQKETTISPMVMSDHARAVAGFVPFVSAAMTVCSARQRAFWIQAGTDPAVLTVTGQPRFDVYASAPRPSGTRPTVLYFSYDDVAYLPSDTGVAYDGTWAELRQATETTLGAAASAGLRIVAKRHPQQPSTADWLGPDVERAPQDADTRQLICGADLVVGFQTTALFEAAAAGRPVVYAAWGEVFERALPLLIPFHEWPALAHHARSPDELAALLRSPAAPPGPEAQAVIEDNIGLVDGQSSARALQVVRSHVGHVTVPEVPTPPLPVAASLRLAAAAASGAARIGTRTGFRHSPRLRAAAQELDRRAHEASAVRSGAG